MDGSSTQISWFKRIKQQLFATSSQRYLLWGFGLFITGFFLMPKAAGHARLYYALVFVPLLYNWRAVSELYRASGLLKLLLLFCCYIFFSTFWSDRIDFEGVSLAVWHTLLTLSFPAAVVLTYKWYPRQFDTIFKIAIMLAAIFAIISMLITYWDAPFPATRLWFFGRMDSPTKASSAYAFFVLLACYFTTLSLPVRDKLIYLVLTGVIFIALVLSQGRGAMIACVLGLVIFLSRYYLLPLILLAAAGAIFFLLQPELWDQLVLNRGLSLRPQVWSYIMHEVGEHWLFGLGFLSPTDTMVTEPHTFHYAHAHSQLMATYRDGGMVGIILFALLWLSAAFLALRLYINGHSLFLALLVLGLICLVPYQDRLITRPREHWLYLWLPLSFLIAYYYADGRRLGDSLEAAPASD